MGKNGHYLVKSLTDFCVCLVLCFLQDAHLIKLRDSQKNPSWGMLSRCTNVPEL